MANEIEAKVPIVRETTPLISVQEMKFVSEIPNCTKIVAAQVLHVPLVVPKTLFDGDDFPPTRVIFCDRDTLLDPLNPEFKDFESDKGRVVLPRTVRKGFSSQGLALPLSSVKFYGLKPQDLQIGQDLTRAMHASKYIKPEDKALYEPPKEAMSVAFPKDVVPRTDEFDLTRQPSLLEDLNKLLAEYKELLPVVTLKLDGTSMTVTGEDEPRICSRNYALHPHDASKDNAKYFAVDRRYKIREKLRETGVSLQGELMGPKIQSNRYGLQDQDEWFVFNGFFNQAYLPHDKLEGFCQDYGFKIVPRIELTRETLPKDVAGWVQLASAQRYPTGEPAEGIVVKFDAPDRRRVSFKVISPLYDEHNKAKAKAKPKKKAPPVK